MKISVGAVLTILVCLWKGAVSQSAAVTTVTYYNSTMKRLSCDISSRTSAVWSEFFPGTDSITIFSYDSSGVTPGPSGIEKYENFNYDLNPGLEFDLIISDVDRNDGGVYQCVTLLPVTQYDYTLIVEVPTESTTINCQQCTGTPPSCQCTCSAIAGFPGNLSLVWTIGTGLLPVELNTDSDRTEDGFYDFSSTTTVEVSGNDAELSCSVQGYKFQAAMEENFLSGITASVLMSSPVCNVSVTEVVPGVCTEVVLNCLCSGFPLADEYTFYTRTGSQNIKIPGSSGSSVTYPVEAGSNTTFLCLGSNGISYGENASAPVLHPCPATTTTPTMTLMATSPPESDNLGLIIGVVIAAVVVGGGAIGFSVYWFGIRTSSRKRSVTGSNNTVTASTNETTNSAAPVYGVVNKSTKKKSDNTDGNGVNSKLQSEPDRVEYAAVNKPESDPQPAPRSSKPPGNNTEPEKMELQYADIDHSNRGRSNEIHQPADAPTEYATVQSVIV